MEYFITPAENSAALPQQPRPHRYPAVVRVLAQFFSYIFHPLFLPAYVTAYLLFLHPYAFAGFPYKLKVYKLITVFFNTGFLPLVSVVLMRLLGFVQSIQLRTQKERIIPYAGAIIFYFWCWYVFRNQPDAPKYFVNFLLGSFLGVCAAWMANISYKISMHATGVGGLVMFFLIQVLTMQEDSALYLSAAILIAGIVCTSRFLVSDHTSKEIYAGLGAGMLCQLVAYWL